MPETTSISIINYGVGNIASLTNMLEHVGADAQLCADSAQIARSRAILLPGVGSFAYAMQMLRAGGFDEAIREAAVNGAMLLGVCLGMQLLARYSEEGDAEGLGLIAADVRRIAPTRDGVKVPNMGWCEVRPARESWMIRSGEPPDRFYFAHSYHMVCDDPSDVVATIAYDGIKTVAVEQGNVCGVQFHPEKSHRYGMRLLADFAGRAT